MLATSQAACEVPAAVETQLDTLAHGSMMPESSAQVSLEEQRQNKTAAKRRNSCRLSHSSSDMVSSICAQQQAVLDGIWIAGRW